MEKKYFKLGKDTRIEIKDIPISKPVELAVTRMKRDMDRVLKNTGTGTVIRLLQAPMGNEEYEISFPGPEQTQDIMVIAAGGDLGFVYGLLFLSEKWLGITPFWFWNDQKLARKETVLIPKKTIFSSKSYVKYRGWFINDEVLISTWNINGENDIVWEMVFEALLRLGGNMVIPGTDKNSRMHRKTASDMGLFISHHHAEPLGAEMFSRAFPELNASYGDHPHKFQELWRNGVEEQKEMKVIWNLGFRGQGDCPFWENDERYRTPEARGKLISLVMAEQADLVKSRIEEPLFCTNLYGEIMELYTQGHLRLPENTIRIRADNGYGKMVSRRQDLYNPRIPALPDEREQEEKLQQGVYYHVSFYDLQAANHITMQPNSLEFIRKELKGAFSSGVRDYLIVNCSNVKPHVYVLEAVAGLWKHGDLKAAQYKEGYIKKYYGVTKPDAVKYLVDCFDDYAKAMIPYGTLEDEHAGEQFYTYLTRGFYHGWMQGKTEKCLTELSWATGDISFSEQIIWFQKKCESRLSRFESLERKCKKVEAYLPDPALWQDSMSLQVKLHLLCIKGAVQFCESYEAFAAERYQKAFYLMGNSAEYFQMANQAMRDREHDKWEGFYANECLSDIKQTAYLLKHLMGYIRNIGEGPHFFAWQREFLYSETDRKVMLITNFENHAEDEELFGYMRAKWMKAMDPVS